MRTYAVVYDLDTGDLVMAALDVLVDGYLGSGMFDECLSIDVEAESLQQAIMLMPLERVLEIYDAERMEDEA